MIPGIDFALLRKGWISISLSLMWRKEWRIAWHKPPTPEQINFVEMYFESDIPVDDFCAERWNREVRE